MADVSKLMADAAPGIRAHLESYIQTDGQVGYYTDMTNVPDGGGDPKSINLVLRTIGRRTGRTLLTPLLYNHWKDEFVIVASKGGADEHPSWFFNLSSAKTVDVQVKNKRYRCSWRISEGAERARIWPFMMDYYPPYRAYQARTVRQIPVVVLTPNEPIEETFVINSGK